MTRKVMISLGALVVPTCLLVKGSAHFEQIAARAGREAATREVQSGAVQSFVHPAAADLAAGCAVPADSLLRIAQEARVRKHCSEVLPLLLAEDCGCWRASCVTC